MNCLRVLLDGILDLFIIKWIYEGCSDAISRKSMCKQVVSTTVNVLCCYDMISSMSQILKGVSDSCRAGSYCQCCYATL